MSSQMKLGFLALLSTAAAAPHYGQHSRFHHKPSGGYGTGSIPPYPTGSWPSAQNSTAAPIATGPTGVFPEDKTTTIVETAYSTETIVSTIYASKPSGGAYAESPSSVAVADASTDAAGVCGPETVYVTATNKVTVTVPAGGVPSVPASSEGYVAPVPSESFVLPSSSPAAAETPKETPAETPAPTKEDSNSILPVTSEAPAETPSPEPTSVPEPTSEAPASSSAPAPSSAAPSASPSSSPGYSASKRGLAYNDPKLCGDFDESKIGFAYNWASKRETELPEGLQYVPMMHRPDVATVEEWLADVKTAVEQGSKAVMGFNEPDHAAQANLTPEQACTDWKMYMNPIASAHPDVTIVGPSVTNGAAPMGLDWLSRFQKACPDAIWHAANIHFYDIYDGAAERFKEHVQEAIDTFGKPTWVTEFGLNPGSASADQAAEFLKGSQEWMEQNKDVPAYAYFMAGTGENQLNTATGLSTIGEVYAST